VNMVSSVGNRVTEMTTVFQSTVKPVLLLAKCIGLINVCYTFDSTGSTVLYANKTYLKFLELTRTSVLLICTYVVYKREFYYLQKFDLLQFWVAIITARMSAKWTIKCGKTAQRRAISVFIVCF